ncbi:hypothetical protein [Methanotorris igneus]|uniref:Uncharacterized protein n=1 Tax=Methanotorris igneus (strain DSM 5666 / JCM 11834 / Kol 5) TaxID=880724 RepID=F6BBV3_METIK|nr:hypothetical protein [Methanotorris igneus]AEF97233.1 hypothetical protein Metig_1701 [Methanotorris igneus Kol 5]
MATLLEEGICIIKDKEVAEKLLNDLKSKHTDWREIKKRAERFRKKLEEGERWLEKMEL